MYYSMYTTSEDGGNAFYAAVVRDQGFLLSLSLSLRAAPSFSPSSSLFFSPHLMGNWAALWPCSSHAKVPRSTRKRQDTAQKRGETHREKGKRERDNVSLPLINPPSPGPLLIRLGPCPRVFCCCCRVSRGTMEQQGATNLAAGTWNIIQQGPTPKRLDVVRPKHTHTLLPPPSLDPFITDGRAQFRHLRRLRPTVNREERALGEPLPQPQPHIASHTGLGLVMP